MIQSIGNFVREIQKQRRLTLAELSGILGYKSPTSLVRIMQQKANKESMLKLIERLRESEQLCLSDQEQRRLDDILEVDQLRKDMDYEAFIRLRNLLKGDQVPSSEVILTISEGGAQTTMLRRYGDCLRWRGFLINGDRAPIFHTLFRMLEKENFRLEHAMFINEDQAHTVQLICALLPLMFSTNYEGYAYTLDQRRESMPTGLMRADLLVCDYVSRDGESRHDMIVFNADGDASVIEGRQTIGNFETLLPPRNDFRSLRSIWKSATGDYLSYSRFCMDLEKNRAICRFKQDVGMDQIPVPLLRKSLEEGPMYASLSLREAVDKLEEVFRQRWQQMLENPHSVHHVMKECAMWQFVRTGRMSDHFWACRSFTKEERAEILQSMIALTQQCPDYRLYFLKDNEDLREDEFILYEGVGLSVIRPGSNYHLDGGHVETMIVQAEFQEIFKKFFLESMIRFHARSPEESLQILQDMRQWCVKDTEPSIQKE